jgi:outer membrane protein, heavy metal efflux system
MSRRHSRRSALAGLAIAALLAGCASTDPARDIEDTERTVHERSGESPRWGESWDEPAEWDPFAGEPLSADRAVTIALRRNPTLRESVSAIAAARAELAQAQTPPNPVVSFAYGAPTDGGAGSMITASVMMQLGWLLSRPHEVAAAEATLRASSLRAADAALGLIAEVRIAHARLVASEAIATASSDAVDALSEVRSLVEERHAAGVASEAECRSARDASAGASRGRTLAEAERHRAQIELLALLAMSNAPVAWRSDGVWPVIALHGDEEERAADAPSRRLDVAAQAVEALEVAARARRAGLASLPELDLGVMAERSMEGDETMGPSITASIPVFDTGSAATARALADLEMARLALARRAHAARAEARVAAATWAAAESAWRESSAPRAALAAREAESQREASERGIADRFGQRIAASVAAERHIEAIRDRFTATEAAIRFERSVGGRPSPRESQRAQGEFARAGVQR